MSRGTPHRSMRVPDELAQAIEDAINSANSRRAAEPYSWAAWVLKAAREKLAHLKRGRRGGAKRRPAQAQGDPCYAGCDELPRRA